jgi:hypothetical protein
MIFTTDLEKVWPDIVGKITAIMKRFADDCDWTEDDVYYAIQNRTACLFLNDEDESFAVCKINPHKRWGTVLFVWIAYGINGKRERNTEFLREIARNVGASRMVWQSPRVGFDRMPGVRRGLTTYSLEV